MKELIYTKYERDYAYFVREDDGTVTEVDAGALLPIERRLLHPSAVGLPSSPEVAGVLAHYYDAEYRRVKCVSWDYSTERDPRGYIEAKFRVPDEDVSVNTVARSNVLWEPLCEVLLEICDRVPNGGFLCLDYLSLCALGTPANLRAALLSVLYTLLPAYAADRTVILFGRGEKLEHTLLAEEAKPGETLFKGSEMLLLSMIVQCEDDVQYAMLLRSLMRDSVGVDCAVFSGLKWDCEDGLNALLGLWTQTQRMPVSVLMQTLGGASFEKMFVPAFHAEAARMWQLEECGAVCDAYVQVMKKTEPFRGDRLFGLIAADLIFTRNRSDITASVAFRLLTEIGNLLHDEDIAAFGAIGADCYDRATTPEEFYLISETLGHDRPANVWAVPPEEFHPTAEELAELPAKDHLALLYSVGQSAKAVRLCERLRANVLQRMRTYCGICRDSRYAGKEATMLSVRELCDICRVSFAADFRNIVIGGRANKLCVQRMAAFWIDTGLTLEWLEAFFSDWEIGDFFMPLHPQFFACLSHAVREAEMPEDEKNVLLDVIAAYYPAAEVLYRAESAEELLKQLDTPYPSNSSKRVTFAAFCTTAELLRFAHLGCTTPAARFAVRLLVNMLFGNPLSVLFLARGYKIQCPSNAFETFFEVLDAVDTKKTCDYLSMMLHVLDTKQDLMPNEGKQRLFSSKKNKDSAVAYALFESLTARYTLSSLEQTMLRADMEVQSDFCCTVCQKTEGKADLKEIRNAVPH